MTLHDQKGFTLIEALVAIAIFSIGFLAVAAMQRSVLLDNVDALNFVYWGYNADNDLVVLNPGISNVDPDDYDDIKRIEVTIVSRSGQSDRGLLGFGRHTDSVTYTDQQGLPLFGPENDNIRRLLLTTSVTCRNMPK